MGKWIYVGNLTPWKNWQHYLRKRELWNVRRLRWELREYFCVVYWVLLLFIRKYKTKSVIFFVVILGQFATFIRLKTQPISYPKTTKENNFLWIDWLRNCPAKNKSVLSWTVRFRLEPSNFVTRLWAVCSAT